jgi:predicted AAA+ superfamily ATPase
MDILIFNILVIYKVVLITNNHEEVIDREGKSIEVIPLYKWLL